MHCEPKLSRVRYEDSQSPAGVCQATMTVDANAFIHVTARGGRRSPERSGAGSVGRMARVGAFAVQAAPHDSAPASHDSITRATR